MTEETVLHIAVVGHTNTGKTSLLRTLTRDRTFGEVADSAGTTRHVQAATVQLDGRDSLIWYDTPGLEDSMALFDWIEQLSRPGQRLDGPERIGLFLRDTKACQLFEQESRVLAQLVKSDATMYVVDVRDPVLAKHRDELAILQMCAKPVLPILNFTAQAPSLAQPWIEAFARQGIHIYVAFDSVTPPSDGEQVLYDTLAQLLGQGKATLQALSSQAQTARERRRKAALSLVAELCVTTAVIKKNVAEKPSQREAALSAQRKRIGDLESACVAELLRLYAFAPDDYTAAELPVTNGQWQADPFSSQALKQAGLSLGKGAAVGAMAGVAVDLLSAGLTMGTGTLIGAGAGSIWNGIDRWGSLLKAQLMGQVQWRVADAVLKVLAVRNLQLIQALERRGHAAQSPIVAHPTLPKKATAGAGESRLPFDPTVFEAVMIHARANPEWAESLSNDRARQLAVQALTPCFEASSLFSAYCSPRAP